MTRGRLIAIVAVVAAVAIGIMVGAFHQRLTRAQYDTIQMCVFSGEARLWIEARILDTRSTEGAGRGFPGPVRLQSGHQDYELGVTEDGLVNVRSHGTDVYLQLTPRLRQGKVDWESRVSPEELSRYCRL